jgi:hypothetical protein
MLNFLSHSGVHYNVAAYPQLVIGSKGVRIDVELVEWAASL